jgi:hypothetical protein
MPVMRTLATWFVLVIAVFASGSSVLHATDEPALTSLASSSYYGRFGFDEANDMVVDADGFVYVAGWSESFSGFDAFVVKLTPDGSQVVYSTFFGGSDFDIAMGLAVDPSGGVYVVGHTTSTDFPLVNAFQTELNGPSDVFIAKLDAAGTLVYSTYYGGSSFENGMAIGVGPTGAIYVAGSTGSPDLPNANGFQQAQAGGADGFALKIAADGSGPVYATYLGGSDDEFVSGLAVDATDHAYIVGGTGSFNFPVASALQPTYGGGLKDGFVTELSPNGAQLVFSTYLGGSNWDHALGIALNGTGAVYLTGMTMSYDFPTRRAYQALPAGGSSDAFLTKLTPGGLALDYSTFFGGDGSDVATKVAVDDEGNAQIAGETFSFTFPLIGAVQDQVNGIDAFYAKFSADGQALLRSTPLGGSGFDSSHGLALSPSGDVWIAGRTDSTDFPIVNAFQPDLAGSVDNFVSRLSFTETPANLPPIAAAGNDHVVFTAGCATAVVLDGSLSSDPDGDHLQFTWSGDFGTAAGPVTPISLLPGSYTFTLTVDDGHGGTASDAVNVTVIDNVGPEIGTVSATPSVLASKNHQMADVSVHVLLTSSCDATSTCRIVNVSSSEPVNGVGDGDTAPDWEVTGALTLRLRAERGQSPQGRIYTITIECVDEAGNASQREVTVSVPRS